MSTIFTIFKFNGETAATPLASFDSLDGMFAFVLSRWMVLNRDSIRFNFSIGNVKTCMLSNEDDFMLMKNMAREFGQFLVEINVDLIGVRPDVVSVTQRVNNVLALPFNVEPPDATFLVSNFKELATKSWGNKIEGVGQVFAGGYDEFRHSFSKFAIQSGFTFKYDRNTRERIGASCEFKESKKCPWRIYAAINKANGSMVIRKYEREHKCGVILKNKTNKHLSSNVIVKEILSEVKSNPKVTATLIKDMFKVRYGLDVNYKLAWRSLEKAKAEVFGDSSTSYGLLKGYINAMKNLDPSSDFQLEYSRDTAAFIRIFVAFGACIKGFQRCIPVLYLDGTFLKGKYKGTLLSAVAKDGNQGLFPIAYAIVDSEDSNNWMWFLTLLRPHLLGRNLTFISDRFIGIITSVQTLFPDSCHSYCLYHLLLNLTHLLKKFPKGVRDSLVLKFIECAYAPTKYLFFKSMGEFMKNGGNIVVKFLKNLHPENYASAFFGGKRYGNFCSTAAESFNAQIKYIRTLPILEVIDKIRILLMVQMSRRQAESLTWTSELCPNMDTKYRETIEIGRSWYIQSSCSTVFEVFSDPNMVVNLVDYTCSCGKWQADCFPCSHALAVITKTQERPFDFIEEYFHSKVYQECYSLPIHPFTSFGQSSIVDESPTLQPPIVKRQRGRPKKKIILSQGELVLKNIKCSRCKTLGTHNRRSCTATNV